MSHQLKQQITQYEDRLVRHMDRICDVVCMPAPQDLTQLRDWLYILRTNETNRGGRMDRGLVSRCRKAEQLCTDILSMRNYIARKEANRAHLSLIHCESEGIRMLRANMRASKVRELRVDADRQRLNQEVQR